MFVSNTGDPVVPYTLTWLEGTKINICYGCNRSNRPKPQAMTPQLVPPALFDVVLKRKELRMYRKPGGELTYSVKPQNCYYELKRKCLIKKNNNFSSEQIEITDDDWGKLSDVHRNALKKEFGITKK